jgi:hypothetical protein
VTLCLLQGPREGADQTRTSTATRVNRIATSVLGAEIRLNTLVTMTTAVQALPGTTRLTPSCQAHSPRSHPLCFVAIQFSKSWPFLTLPTLMRCIQKETGTHPPASGSGTGRSRPLAAICRCPALGAQRRLPSPQSSVGKPLTHRVGPLIIDVTTKSVKPVYELFSNNLSRQTLQLAGSAPESRLPA